MKLLILNILLLFIINCSDTYSDETKKKIVVPDKDPLSYSWAIYSKSHPGKYKKVSKDKAIQMAKKFNSQGLKLKKKKQDAKAVELFEKAIEYYSYSELYYNYGNSLSNIPRLEDSIKAYKIAEKLNYRRPELVQYNIACAYSRMNNIEKAYHYLALAIDRGYNAFKYIQKDPDMANLRKRPEWEEKIQSLIPKSVKFEKKDFVGKVVYPTPRIPIDYFLCSTGVIIEYSVCEKGYFKGKWNYEKGDIVVKWELDCREEPDGKMIMASGACEEYEKYKFTSCKKPDKDSSKKFPLITNSDIIYMKGIMKPDPNYEYFPSLKKGAKEPKACDPKFIPKSTKDLEL
ncbi:MAG: hypothetical protein KDK36_16240 [Leptospiraceae bacterium]|nr:hypothetical protein [Leptospiraceae bacterium]